MDAAPSTDFASDVMDLRQVGKHKMVVSPCKIDDTLFGNKRDYDVQI